MPIVVVRAAQQNADVQVDVHQVCRNQLAVHHHAWSHEHAATPIGHFRVGIVADIRIVERTPATEKNAPSPDLFITGEGFVEEIEQIVMQRHNLLHEFHVFHQPYDVIGEELNRRDGTHPAGIQRRRMHVASFHQAEHLAGHAAHLQRFKIERSLEGIERRHDVADGL